MHILGFPIELVILDVDGVILDILGKLRVNLEKAASHFKLPLEPIAKNLKEIGEGKVRIKGNAYDSARMLWPDLTEAKIIEFVSYFYEIERRCPYKLIDGALDVIILLRSHNITLALATNNPMKSLLWRLEAVGIDPSWFSVIVTKDHRNSRSKTLDPIFEHIDIAHERALYIGDLQIDWDIARKASVLFFAVLSGGVPREAFLAEGVPVTHIFDRLADIIKHIEMRYDTPLCV